MIKKFGFQPRKYVLLDKTDDGTGTGKKTSGAGADDDTKTDDGTDDDDATGDDDDATKKKPAVSDSEAKLLKENMKRKEELQRAREELAAASAITSVVQELGGIDALKGLVQAARDAETAKLEEKGEWTKLKEAMTAEHQRQLTEATTRAAAIEAEKAKLEGRIIDLTIGQQFASSQYIAGDLILTPTKARALYGDHFDFVDGNVVGYTKPKGAADRSPIVDASGDPLPFDAAMAKIIDSDPEKDHLLRAKGKSGSGSMTNNGKKPPATVEDTSSMTGIERISHALSSRKK
jgi:hypothetical protein